MDIDLHIEELVLHGFAAQDRYRIAEAVRLELTRLLRAQGVNSRGARAFEQLQAGSIEVRAGRPQSTGREIARAIHRSLQSAGSPGPNPRAGRGARRP